MKICEGCKWNIQNQMADIQKLHRRGCDNFKFLEQQGINKSCMELFAIQILSEDLVTYMDLKEPHETI